MESMNCKHGDYDVEDTCHLQFGIDKLEWQKTPIYGSAFISCIHPEKREELVVHGETGSAILTPNHLERRNRKQEVVDRLDAPGAWASAMINQIDYFMDVIEGKKKPYYSTPEFQMDNHVPTLEACYRSAQLGRRVEVKEIIGG